MGGTPYEVSGWGYWKADEIGLPLQEYPENLQWSAMFAVDRVACGKKWPSHGVTPRMNCAEMENMTPCMGDNGTPLTVYEGGMKKLAGSGSWGHNRCLDTMFYPAVFSNTREPHANAWIKQTAKLNYFS